MDLSTLPLKKIAIGVVLAAVAVAAGFGIYYLFFRAPEEAAPVNEVVNEVGGLPGVPTGVPTNQVVNEVPTNAALPEAAIPERITKITAPKGVSAVAQGGVTQVSTNYTETAKGMTVANGQNNPYLYNQSDGYFYSINPQGTLTKISISKYPNVQDISWSPNGDQAILEFPDGSNILYNFRTNRQVTLPESWNDFSFNSQGTKIAFKDTNTNLEYNWLAMANPDGSQQKYIEHLGRDYDRVEVNWSKSGHAIATYNEAKDSTTTAIHLIGQNDENYRAIDGKGFNLSSMWVPDGKRLIYDAYSFDTSNKPMLYIVDAYGDRIGYNHNSLGLNTWIEKCTFQGESTMYCAVPKYLPEHAGFQPTVADDIPDYIYKIDLNTGSKAIIAEPELTYTIDTMQVSADGKYIYFTDKTTGALHYIELK